MPYHGPRVTFAPYFLPCIPTTALVHASRNYNDSGDDLASVGFLKLNPGLSQRSVAT